jgi:hypothetical protein
LVRGSWWRIFGIAFVVTLVALGLAILVSAPFVVLKLATGSSQSSTLGILLDFLGSVVVEIAIAPVVFISSTLLYYDLRVRKEKYDLTVISQEVGASGT